jgi:hypothetical protein
MLISAGSTVFAVDGDTTAPSVPVHESPADGVSLTTAEVGLLNWTTVTDPSEPVVYYYESSMSPAVTMAGGPFVSPAYGSGALSASEINAAGTPEGTYYWHVRAVDSLGNSSEWSAPWELIVDNTPPVDTEADTPTLVYPADDSTFSTTGLTYLDWTDVTDDAEPVTYLYESSISPDLNEDGSFVSKWYESPELPTSQISTGGPSPEGVYYWHVRAKDGLGNLSPWAAAWKVTIDDTPTEICMDDGANNYLEEGECDYTEYPFGAITAPALDETLSGVINLVAEYFDGDEVNDDAVQWALRAGNCTSGTVAGNVDSFNSPFTWDGSAFSASVDASAFAVGSYCFVFNPTDDIGEVNVRETRLFNIAAVPPVDTTAPDAPTHVSPANNATTTAAALTQIDWSDVTDPSTPVVYYYEVANNPATNEDGSLLSPIYSFGPTETSFNPAAGTPEGTYYWHVRAEDNEGNSSSWTDTWKIVVDNDYVETVLGCTDPEALNFNELANTNDESCEYEETEPTEETYVVRAADLETETDRFVAAVNESGKWFFYNDENDTINNTLGSFVEGPATAPLGDGSVQISVTGTERRNLATYQFKNVLLEDIRQLKFSTYNPIAGNGGSSNRSAYLHFNVDINGSDTWQRRLVFVPQNNGPVVQNTWQEWNAADESAMWSYSGATWPTPTAGSNIGDVGVSGTTLKTWAQILEDYPGIKTRTSDSFMGLRVGEPYADGYTENIDMFVIKIDNDKKTYDFEPTIEEDEDEDEDEEITETETPTDTESRRGSRRRGGSVAGAFTGDGEVLGASTGICEMYITDYMREGGANNPAQVTKLQSFLGTEGFVVPTTGFFGPLTTQAVSGFQVKYTADILQPWVTAGLATDLTPNGNVYKLTRYKINNLVCAGSETMPVLP